MDRSNLPTRPLAALLALAVALAPRPAAPREDGRAGEYRVKAALLYNLGKFVEWPVPQSAGGAVVIGILGEDPFGAELDAAVAGRHVGAAPLQVRRFGRVEDLAPCHILFISGSEKERLPLVLERLGTQPVLSVIEGEPGARTGTIVTLTIVDGKVRFEVDAGASRLAGLRISSKLLALATRVRGGPGELTPERRP